MSVIEKWPLLKSGRYWRVAVIEKWPLFNNITKPYAADTRTNNTYTCYSVSRPDTLTLPPLHPHTHSCTHSHPTQTNTTSSPHPPTPVIGGGGQPTLVGGVRGRPGGVKYPVCRDGDAATELLFLCQAQQLLLAAQAGGEGKYIIYIGMDINE